MFRPLTTLLLLLASAAYGQRVLDLPLNGSERGKNVSHFLDSLQKKYPIRFYTKREWLENFTFPEETTARTVREALDQMFRESGLSYIEMYPDAIAIVLDPTQLIRRQAAIEQAKREKQNIRRLAFGSAKMKNRKSRVTISGKVMDSKTNEPMTGAAVQLSDSSTVTTTNAEGKFSFTIPAGEYVLNIGYINYDDVVIDLSAYDDGLIDVKLEEVPVMLQEVVVQGAADQEITKSRIGQTQISMAELKRAPALLGEADLVKQIQTMPGVTTVGEAATGFNVRGGSVDQNLVLYDGMPVFNTSHAFGFLSSFNSQAIRDVSFYRGGIPADYGGRVSSVLDIRSKEGDYEKWGGSAGIGLITSNVLVSGPIKKDKTSIIASLRSTYSDWLVHSIRTNYADLSNSKVSFYDGTIKLTHRVNQDTKLSLAAYASRDAFRIKGDSTYQNSNWLVSARMDHRFSEKFSMDITGGISAFSYSVINDEPTTASKLSYDISVTCLKLGFSYRHNRHQASFGAQSQFYNFNPGTFEPVGGSNAKAKTMPLQQSFEHALYINDMFTVNEKITAEAGLRVPVFTSQGTVYSGLEPRASLRISTGSKSSVKAGYSRMYQFLHLITNTTAVTPVDIWQPSGPAFKPQYADQISIGYFRQFKDRAVEASVEGFYKQTENILDFRNGANLILNDHLEQDLLRGKASAYGVETAVSLVKGRLTGSASYTFARSLRQVNGPTEAESINSGKEYPANYDQPHVINVAWRFAFSRRYYLTGNFTYHTGRPISAPLSVYYYESVPVANFSERNQFRIADYHRLDLAFVIEGNHKRKKLGDGTWIFSLYNVYARKNPYSVFYQKSEIGQFVPYQLSIVGTIVPSVSYNFKF